MGYKADTGGYERAGTVGWADTGGNVFLNHGLSQIPGAPRRQTGTHIHYFTHQKGNDKFKHDAWSLADLGNTYYRGAHLMCADSKAKDSTSFDDLNTSPITHCRGLGNKPIIKCNVKLMIRKTIRTCAYKGIKYCMIVVSCRKHIEEESIACIINVYVR